MKKVLFFLLIFGFFQSANAQGIRRATLGSIGNSSTVGDFRISSSFGQKSIACSVVMGQGIIVRQGFQQPPQQDACPFTVAAVWEEIQTECGFYYTFEYQGDANTETAFFQWDFGTGGFPAISNEVNPMQVGFAIEGLRTIRLTVEEEGCTSSFTFTLDAQKADFGANPITVDPECLGAAEGEISFEFLGGTEPLSFRWEDGSSTETLDRLVAGNYPYTITSADGCEVTGVATIFDPETGLALSGEMTQDICSTSTFEGAINLIPTGTTGAVEYQWSNGESSEDISNLSSGTYTVTVYDAGCQAEMLFILDDCSEISITDVITPNGDGINDGWIIPGIEDHPNNVVEIYNRWGNLVYTAAGYANDWQGTNTKGENLTTGGYYYVVKLNDESDTTLGGSITVVR